MKLLLLGPAEPRDVLGDPSAPLGTGAGIGGTQVSLLAKELSRAGLHVEVVTGSPYVETLWVGGSNPRLTVVPFRPDARRRLADGYRVERAALARCAESIESDVTHAHWTYEFAMAALDVDPSAIITARDVPLEELYLERRPGLVWRLAMALNVRMRVENLTFNSPYTAMKWTEHFRWRGEQIVVPNVATRIERGPKPSARGPLVTSVGHMSRTKNLSALLRAWPRVLSEVPAAELHLVGYDLAPSSKAACRLVGNLPQVHLRGPMRHVDLLDLLRVSAVLAHPSRQETVGNVLIEAMQTGAIAIGSGLAPAVRWVLAHGAAGVLADPNDPAEFARAIAHQLRHGHDRDARAERAWSHWEQTFSAEAVIPQWLSIYELCRK